MDAVERALDESRGAIAALNRPIDEPFDRALGHAALDIANRVGARLHLDVAEDVDVSPDWRDALLRISREAIANAVRHGRARTISVQLREGDSWRLRVTDDGDGFDLVGAAIEPELRAHEHARARGVARRPLRDLLDAWRGHDDRGGGAMSRPVRVLIADDHAPTRAGVRMALEHEGCEVCAEAASAGEAIRAALDERPDICLVDLGMPGDGFRAVSEIASQLPDTPVRRADRVAERGRPVRRPARRRRRLPAEGHGSGGPRRGRPRRARRRGGPSGRSSPRG